MKRKLPSVVDAVEFRRDAYRLNQREWAIVLGMTPSHYSEFVHGKRPLTSRAMAQAFAHGVPAECLFQCRADRHILHIKKALAQGVSHE